MISGRELIKLVSPKHQNLIQRIGFFIAIALCVLFVVLHNPLDGYDIKYGYCDDAPNTICLSDDYYPFSEWSTEEPIIKWFGSVLHLLGSILATLIIGFVWLVTFHEAVRDEKEN